MAADSMEIDDALYSRQRYVLGDTAMHKMAQSHVFLSGMGGLGVEIAKNIVLAGIKALTIHDTKQCKTWDLGTNFFAREDDVLNVRNRAEAAQHHIAELNPYVQVMSSTDPLNEITDISFLKQYQCVILTEMKMSLQKKINAFCHTQHPPIKFISADVYGIWARLFCDFGDEFEVLDTTGEEPKEIFISNISQAICGIVTCLDNNPHKLETGQFVIFREINGMSALNGSTHQITVISPYSFSIGNTTDMEPYLHGGIAVQVKIPKVFHFEPLEKQLSNPTYLVADFSKPEAPLQIHIAMLALNEFQESFARMPNIGCLQDAEEMVKIALSLSKTLEGKHQVNEDIVKWLSKMSQGSLAPLTAALGGIASQEVLKAVTGKFSPLQQWLYIDALELVTFPEKAHDEEFLPRGDRYDALRVCIGDSLCQKLKNLNVFLVGCGAIGCEMLKNFALLGVGTGGERGKIEITDPDLIEKSNLNRQFLFRPHHIQKPKSCTAAAATRSINPEIKIDSYLNKVCPATENIYNDDFYIKQDIIVTALDNVEARRYIDSRCLASLRPLLDSGTMGTKGHTEVIVPHLTESYNSHRDPPEEEIPFCTIKSFPAATEHTIQWARDKFENAFSHKPSLFNKFWQTYPSAEEVLQRIKSGESLEGSFQVIKCLGRRPRNWSQCVELARLKFEKYFNHKALQLLHSFPIDTRLKDGSLFWQSPKRPPFPIQFDFNDPLHYSFILSTAKLFATIHCISFTEKDVSQDTIFKIISGLQIQEFRPSNKVVQTDEAVRKPDPIPVSSEDERNALLQLENAILANKATKNDLQMKELNFEKDDDSNGHIDFITAASNLRAKMYNIEPADRLKTKRIAGKIIPAIATSTAAVSGLVALELIKVVGVCPFQAYKNCFFNLAIPIIVFTETAAVRKTEIRNGISFTIWDRWIIHGKDDFTLLDFINTVKEKYGIEPIMVVQGVKMLYVPVMPGHVKRLKLTSDQRTLLWCAALWNTSTFSKSSGINFGTMNSLNHLKTMYRLRFFNGVGKKNATDIQREDVLECVQDCFEPCTKEFIECFSPVSCGSSPNLNHVPCHKKEKEQTKLELAKDNCGNNAFNTFAFLLSPDKMVKFSGNKVSEEIQENDIEVLSLGSPILPVEDGGEEKGERKGEKSYAKQNSAIVTPEEECEFLIEESFELSSTSWISISQNKQKPQKKRTSASFEGNKEAQNNERRKNKKELEKKIMPIPLKEIKTTLCNVGERSFDGFQNVSRIKQVLPVENDKSQLVRSVVTTQETRKQQSCHNTLVKKPQLPSKKQFGTQKKKKRPLVGPMEMKNRQLVSKKSLEDDLGEHQLDKKKNLHPFKLRAELKRTTSQKVKETSLPKPQSYVVHQEDSCEQHVAKKHSNVSVTQQNSEGFLSHGPLCSNEMFRREWNPFNMDDSDSDKSADLEENLHSSISNSLKHKLILPTDTPNVRRSKRIRIKPLQYWRGERIDYKISASGGFIIGGIISPEQRESRKPKTKVATKSVSEMENLHNNSMIKKHFPQPAVVFDETSNQQIILECMNNGSSPVYCISNETLSVYKYLSTPSFSSGKIILNPLKEKGYQYSYTDTLVFHISCGKLLLTLYDQSYCLTAGNYFFIPPGKVYNIRNLLNKECVILFTQLKGKEK